MTKYGGEGKGAEGSGEEKELKGGNKEMESTEKDGTLGDWDDYVSGNFLKADQVGGVEDLFEVARVEEVISEIDNKTKIVRLQLVKGDQEFLFDLNKTNSVYLKNSGIKHPKDLRGKKIQFQKVKVMNPKLKKEVDGLRIFKVF